MPDSGYRQATRNNVLLSRVIIGLAAAIILLSGGYIVLLPLKTTEWVIYEFSSTNNTFVRIAKAGDDLTANEALISMMMRKYVMDRETINHVDEQDRYASVMAQSADQVATYFRSVYGGDHSPLNISGFTRAVLITRDSRLGEGMHQVEFQTTDAVDDKRPDVRYWVASMVYTWKAQKARVDALSMNPAGLVISQYSLAQRK